VEDLQHYIADSHPHQTDRLGPRFLHRMYRKLWGCPYPGPFEWEVQDHAELVAAIEENGRFKPDSLHHATGVVITTWNRPQYLRPCLDSLAKSHLNDCVIILIDDASDDPETLGILAGFDLPVPLIKLTKTRRSSMHVSLDIGWCLAQNLGCKYLCNLDADALVRSDWLLTLRRQFESLPFDPDLTLLSGFNRANSADTLEDHGSYLRKYRLGGINYFFTPAFFRSVRFLLFSQNWDSHIQYFCTDFSAKRYRMICCKPSVVQHIGREGINAGVNSAFDCAIDFLEG
jgi:glycosyltransferase involved in cell wall biosynthesis